jgi:hypothetical protein
MGTNHIRLDWKGSLSGLGIYPVTGPTLAVWLQRYVKNVWVDDLFLLQNDRRSDVHRCG